MQYFKPFLAAGFVASLIVAVPPAANAFSIDSTTPTNSTFEVSWELMGSHAANPVAIDLTGIATFEYLGTDLGTGAGGSNQMLFGLTLENTTVSNASGSISGIGLTAFGFGTDQNFTLASWGSDDGSADDGSNERSNDGVVETVVNVNPFLPGGNVPDMNGADANGNAPVECLEIPNNTDQVKCIEVVAATDSNGDGILAGDADGFQFVLEFDQAVGSAGYSVNFDAFAVAYGYQVGQAAGSQLLRVSAAGNAGTVLRVAAASAATQVPVPGPLLLFGAGVLALSRIRFRS